MKRDFFFLIEATSLNLGALGRGCGEGARTRAGCDTAPSLPLPAALLHAEFALFIYIEFFFF